MIVGAHNVESVGRIQGATIALVDEGQVRAGADGVLRHVYRPAAELRGLGAHLYGGLAFAADPPSTAPGRFASDGDDAVRAHAIASRICCVVSASRRRGPSAPRYGIGSRSGRGFGSTRW